MLLGDRLDHELEEGVLVGRAQAGVVLPVHLELAVGVLVVVLVGVPAERDHGIADFLDHLVAAHQRLLVVAGLGLRIGAVRDRRAVGRDQEILALDPRLHLVAVLGRGFHHPLQNLARVLRHRLAVHHQIAGHPRHLRLPRQLDGGVGLGHHQHVRVRRRQVEPSRKPGKARPRLGDHVDGGGRHDLGPHGAEQIDEGDQEILDALVLGVARERCHVRPSYLSGWASSDSAGPNHRSVLSLSRCSASCASLDPTYAPFRPGIHSVPASGTCAMAAASTVRATRSSGSRLCTWLLPLALAMVWHSKVSTER